MAHSPVALINVGALAALRKPASRDDGDGRSRYSSLSK